MECDGYGTIARFVVTTASGVSQCLETTAHTMHDRCQRTIHAWAATGLLAFGQSLRPWQEKSAADIRNQAVKNNAIDPTYKPFEIMEKISVAILTTQEVIISVVYLVAAVRILRLGESVQRKGNQRRVQLLFLANVVIICVDICTITLEYLAFWGVWCSFKGFGYSVKLKVEFAILNQLRDSVKGSSGESYDMQLSSKTGGLSLRNRAEQNARFPGQLSRLSMKRQTFEQIADLGRIEKRTDIDVRHDDEFGLARQGSHVGGGNAKSAPSESSSEIEFVSRGL